MRKIRVPVAKPSAQDQLNSAPVGSDTGRDEQTPFERVYRGVIRALYEGRFVPGQRLVAPDLMREFDAGRGTIREVLQRLGSTGVVRLVPQKGARVRRLSRREVLEVLDLVEIMIGLAARGAALAVTDQAMRDKLVERFEALANSGFDADFNGFVSTREDYYRCILQLAGNRELQRIFPSIQVHIMRMQLRTFNRAGDAVDPADFQILQDAIMKGDPQSAERAGRIHVQKTMGRIAELPSRAFEPED
jgi:DNA-binding GntR family transcriptional regulator